MIRSTSAASGGIRTKEKCKKRHIFAHLSKTHANGQTPEFQRTILLQELLVENPLTIGRRVDMERRRRREIINLLLKNCTIEKSTVVTRFLEHATFLLPLISKDTARGTSYIL